MELPLRDRRLAIEFPPARILLPQRSADSGAQREQCRRGKAGKQKPFPAAGLAGLRLHGHGIFFPGQNFALKEK